MLAARGESPESPDEKPAGTDNDSISRPLDEDDSIIGNDQGAQEFEDHYNRNQRSGGGLSPDTSSPDSVSGLAGDGSSPETVSGTLDAGPGDASVDLAASGQESTAAVQNGVASPALETPAPEQDAVASDVERISGEKVGLETSPDAIRTEDDGVDDEVPGPDELQGDAGPEVDGSVPPVAVSVDQEKQDALGRVQRFEKDVAMSLYRRLLRDCGPLEVNPPLGGRLYDEAEAILDKIDDLLSGDDVAGLAFDQFREGIGDQAIRVDTGVLADSESPVWFVGDLHGDLVALEYALQFIRSQSPDAIIVFLGDLVDDGGYGAQVVLRVFREICHRPSKICVLAGNHDEALHFSEGQFSATVSPCEFSEWLNRHAGENSVVSRLGETFVRFVQQIPRSLFFDDGLLVAHGGIPLFPDKIDSFDDLNSSECLQDFVWTRAHPRARRRRTHRQYLGCGFGVENFADFSRRMNEVCGQTVKRMIRGHDHITDKARFDLFSRWQDYPMLTINTMCRRLERELVGPFVHQPCVAEWIPDGIPKVYPLRIRDKVVRKFYDLTVVAEASSTGTTEPPPATDSSSESSVDAADP